MEPIICLIDKPDHFWSEHSWEEVVVQLHILVVLRWVALTRLLLIPVIATVTIVLLTDVVVLRTGMFVVVVIIVARSGLSVILVLVVPVPGRVLLLTSLGRSQGVGSSPPPRSVPRATPVVLVHHHYPLVGSHLFVGLLHSVPAWQSNGPLGEVSFVNCQ